MSTPLQRILDAFVTGPNTGQNKFIPNMSPIQGQATQALGGGGGQPIAQNIRNQQLVTAQQKDPVIGQMSMDPGVAGAQLAYGNTQDQRFTGGMARGLEGMWDAFQEPKKRAALQQQLAQQQTQKLTAEQQVKQDRADATLKLATASGQPPQKAQELARLAFENPEVAQKYAEQAFKQPDISTMQKEWEYIQSMPDGQQKDMLTQKFMKQNETIMKMPLEFGYVYGKDGTIQLAPGADNPRRMEIQKEAMEMAEMKATSNFAQVKTMNNMTNAIRQVKRSIGLTGPGTTGLPGAIMAGIPGTDARNLVEMIKTQQGQIAFQTLLEMRQASKTGGALGNVSNREIELLYSSFGALDTMMSDEELNTTLTDILMKFEATKFALDNENRFAEEGLSPQEMKREVDNYLNQTMAKEANVPPEAMQELIDDPGSIGYFEETFGFRPRL
jgi:hypothetical protein